MNRSDSIAALATALSKAQASIEGAAKDKMNPHFRSKYADLASVVDAIKKPLADNGLSYTQVIHDAELAVKVETIVMHESGEWLSNGFCSVPVDKSNAQGYGSALTYARRYSLSAAFGVAPEDDDGNAASKAAPTTDTLQHVVRANVKPTAGLLEQLDPEVRKRVESVASEVVDCMEVMETATAYDVIEEAKFDTDQKAAMWTLLGSGIRSALKKEHDKRQKALLVTNEASQP